MDTRIIDLHVHSTASDGTLSPTEIIELAVSTKLSALALTDHDTVAGIPEAKVAAAAAGIELISGIELSCGYLGKEVHMLGLCIDETNPEFLQKLQEFRDSRDNRNVKMVENLQREGFAITVDALREAFPDCVLTRAHIARYLVDQGYVKNMNTVFSTLIGDTCRCYVPREKITPMEAVNLIRSAGGLAFLAHPLLYHMNANRLNTLVTELKTCGLTGIEAVYSTNIGVDERNMKNLAKVHGLLISGGSDFHGDNKPFIHLGTGKGHLYIPYSILQDIKNQYQLQHPSNC